MGGGDVTVLGKGVGVGNGDITVWDYLGRESVWVVVTSLYLVKESVWVMVTSLCGTA